MSWIYIDDKIGHHPKCIQAGCDSWLWVCAIGYAKKFLTNGFIPDSAIDTLAGGVANIRSKIVLLAKCGLLDRVQHGYTVHDFLDFNNSKTEIIEQRAKLHDVRVKAGRTGGLHRAERAKQANGQVKQSAKQTPSKLLDPASSKRQARGSSYPSPSPSPSPKKKEQANSLQLASSRQQASIKAVALPRHTSSNAKLKSVKAVATDTPNRNIKIITKCAHEAIEKVGLDSEDLNEEIKLLCAKRKIAYNSTVITSAIKSATFQRGRKR